MSNLPNAIAALGVLSGDITITFNVEGLAAKEKRELLRQMIVQSGVLSHLSAESTSELTDAFLKAWENES